MRNRLALAAIIGAVLVLGVLVGVVARPLGDDIIIQTGPRSDIQKLYRSFDGGAWEAETVALAPFDETTGAALIIDTPHHEVHEGEMFHAEYTNPALANEGSLHLLIETKAKDAHLVFEVFAGGQVTVTLFEAPTIGATGTGIGEYNMNRTSALTATVAISHTPTVTNAGSVTLVNGRVLPGGTSQQTRVGGGVRQGIEWILAPNTQYLLRVSNTSGGAVAANVVAEWYEED